MYKHLEGIIFDWAGTTVDYGCFAPVKVFIEIFDEIGIRVTNEEARIPMGLLKWDHIKEMLMMDRIQSVFVEKYERSSTDEDVDALFKNFEPKLLSILNMYADPIDHVVDAINLLKNRGLKIGSTTGYNQTMIDIVSKEAMKKGYQPDNIVTPTSTENIGRPYPYMIFKNIQALGLIAPWKVIKVGDTLSDIKEGKNAGTWSIGVLEGSSQIGLTQAEFDALTDDEKSQVKSKAMDEFYQAGAHFVIDTMKDLPDLSVKIDGLIETGKMPHVIQ